MKLDVREILSTLYGYKGEEIIEGAMYADHVNYKYIKFYGILKSFLYNLK